ncbi:pre-60S factor rei1 [Elasticomyces elasticus]|nr:pre-60S factor rei1 [Elasticomyces elasticus]
MIAYSSEEEQMDIGEFYDFRSTYSDEDSEDEEEEQVNGGVNLGVKRAVKTTVQGEDGENVVMEDDEDWESDSTLSSVPTDEIVILDFTRIPTVSTCMPITDRQQSTTTDRNSIFLRDAQPVIAVYANTTSRT